MIRILLTGRDGQVGRELCGRIGSRFELIALGRAELDLSRPESIDAALTRVDPDLVINAAAYTAVDRAESEADLALAINATAPAALARWVERAGSSLVHFSTDYVFDGEKPVPYTEDDPTAPLSVYGRTKLQGEQAIGASGAAHLILRTSWVYAPTGSNFLNAMLRLAREREELSIVDDEVGAPTSSRALAAAVGAILATVRPDRRALHEALAQRGGIFHATCGGATSWYGFAKRIFESVPDDARKLVRVVPIKSAQFPTTARRPKNSRLSNARIKAVWGVELPLWGDALREAIAARG